jgi:uncharacterized protein YbjQ (UPF0145 family)
MDDLIQLAFTLLSIVLGFLFGRKAEEKHYASIRDREKTLLHLPVRAELTPESSMTEAKLVMGNVVIASDRFKALVGSLQGFFGGKVPSLESLMDRARREAILRMKADAAAWGAKEVIHLRIDSSMLDNQGVEVFASGTAVK